MRKPLARIQDRESLLWMAQFRFEIAECDHLWQWLNDIGRNGLQGIPRHAVNGWGSGSLPRTHLREVRSGPNHVSKKQEPVVLCPQDRSGVRLIMQTSNHGGRQSLLRQVDF